MIGLSRKLRKRRAAKRAFVDNPLVARAPTPAIRRELQRALSSEVDDTVPLVFDQTGLIHIDCGGPARRSSHYGMSECLQCGCTVPNRAVEWERES